jgi:hypothetical protein
MSKHLEYYEAELSFSICSDHGEEYVWGFVDALAQQILGETDHIITVRLLKEQPGHSGVNHVGTGPEESGGPSEPNCSRVRTEE